MKIEQCGILLATALRTTNSTAPQGTFSGRIAASVLEMAEAYQSDGSTFCASGDTVNALASYYYGFGWLHFGISAGILSSPSPVTCPFEGPGEILENPEIRQRLAEKTSRYARLLDLARSSVECASDPSTASYDFANKVQCIAATYADSGRRYMTQGTDEDALACFSYGHGWLDAGVTAGLFRILAAREIFTV
jgi:hypothetical protein